MLPEGGSASNRGVAKLGKVFCKAFVGNAAGLFEARHSLSDLKVDIAIGSDGVEVVLGDDFVRYEGKWELHVFEAVHGGTIVEVFYVQYHESGARGGEGAIEETFGGGEASTLGGGDAGEIKAVTANSDSNTMGFVFGWSDGGDEATIGHFAANGNGGAGDEKNSVRSCGHALPNSLGKTA